MHAEQAKARPVRDTAAGSVICWKLGRRLCFQRSIEVSAALSLPPARVAFVSHCTCPITGLPKLQTGNEMCLCLSSGLLLGIVKLLGVAAMFGLPLVKTLTTFMVLEQEAFDWWPLAVNVVCCSYSLAFGPCLLFPPPFRCEESLHFFMW